MDGVKVWEHPQRPALLALFVLWSADGSSTGPMALNICWFLLALCLSRWTLYLWLKCSPKHFCSQLHRYWHIKQMTTVVQRQRCVPSTRGWCYPSEDFGSLESWVSSNLTFKLGANRVTIMLKLATKKRKKRHPFLNINVCIKADFDGTLLIVIQCLPFTHWEAVVGLISRPQEVCLLTLVQSVLVIRNVYWITVITNDDMHSLQS